MAIFLFMKSIGIICIATYNSVYISLTLVSRTLVFILIPVKRANTAYFLEITKKKTSCEV